MSSCSGSTLAARGARPPPAGLLVDEVAADDAVLGYSRYPMKVLTRSIIAWLVGFLVPVRQGPASVTAVLFLSSPLPPCSKAPPGGARLEF